MSDSPYKTFRYWLCDGNINSTLDESVLKAIYIVSALAMFSRFGKFTMFLNDMLNSETIYEKELQPKKYEFFLELKEYCIQKRLSPWDLSFINLKKEKFEYKEVRNKFPLLKPYEVELLFKIMKQQKNQSFLEILNKSDPKAKKLTKAMEKIANG